MSSRSFRVNLLAAAALAALLAGLALPTPAATQTINLKELFRISLADDGGQSTQSASAPMFIRRPQGSTLIFAASDPATGQVSLRRHSIPSGRGASLLYKDGNPLVLDTSEPVSLTTHTTGSVIFSTLAANLAADLNPATRDIFFYDPVSRDVRLISKGLDAQGRPVPPNGDSHNPALGVAQLAFDSYASNLAGPDTNGQRDVFVYSQQQGTRLASIAADGGGSGNGGSHRPAVSQSDRYVVFSSSASNLTATPTDGAQHIFLRDLTGNTTTLVSVAHGGGLPDGPSDEAAISGDGRYVAFASQATNLIATPTSGRQIFVRDLQAGLTELISVGMGLGYGNGASETPAISFDGRYVAYASTSANLTSGDTNRSQDIFLLDRQTRKTVRVSSSWDATPTDGAARSPTISFDGRFVGFVSSASSLVAGDTNGVDDVFVRDSGFLLERDGFAFDNFNYDVPQLDFSQPSALEDQAWRYFKATFHESRTELMQDGVLKPTAWAQHVFNNYYAPVGLGGNCFGMATISTGRFNKIGSFPNNPEGVTLPPELRSPWIAPHDLPAITLPTTYTVGADAVHDYVHLYQARQLSFDFNKWFADHERDSALQSYQTIRSYLLRREAVGVLIFYYIRDQGWAGHAMVATGVHEQGTQAYIDVYDNNYPDDPSHAISLNLQTGAWSYQLWPGMVFSGLNENLLWYDEATVVTEAHLPGDCGPSYYHGVRCDSPAAAAVMVTVSGDTLPLITDAQGRGVGYSGGRPVSEIPGASVIPTFGPLPGDAINLPTRVLLPAGADYTVTVAPGVTGGAYTVAAYGAGSAMEVRNLTAIPGKSDTIMLRNGVLDATVVSAADGSYCHAVTREVAADTSRDYESCVSGAAGAPLRFALTPAGSALTTSNGGAAPVTVVQSTTQVGAGAGESTAELVVPARSSVTTAFDTLRTYLPMVDRQ